MIIELVSLRVRSQIDETDFLRAAEAATSFLRDCRGFIRRRLATCDAGDQIDYAEWQSLEDALETAKRFDQTSETRDFNAALEPGTVVMSHLTTYHAAN